MQVTLGFFYNRQRIAVSPGSNCRSTKRSRPFTHLAASTAAAVLGLLQTGALAADEPMAPPQCSMPLLVEVTPDVPNPGDAGFLSSLLGDHPGYQLFLLGVVDDTHVNLQLQGPGPTERCKAIIDSMRDDGRVVSIEAN
jgi:hypothetical protein